MACHKVINAARMNHFKCANFAVYPFSYLRPSTLYDICIFLACRRTICLFKLLRSFQFLVVVLRDALHQSNVCFGGVKKKVETGTGTDLMAQNNRKFIVICLNSCRAKVKCKQQVKKMSVKRGRGFVYKWEWEWERAHCL